MDSRIVYAIETGRIPQDYNFGSALIAVAMVVVALAFCYFYARNVVVPFVKTRKKRKHRLRLG